MRSAGLIFRTLLRWSARIAAMIAIVIGCLIIADSLHQNQCRGSPTHKGESYESIGERLTLLNTGQETNGKVLEIDVSFKPSAETTLLKWREVHVHPYQEERFEVISGNVRFRIGDREQVLTAGQTITGPPNTPHAWTSADGKDIHMRAELRPALHTDAAFSSAQHVSAVRGKVSLLQAAVIMSEFDGVPYPPAPGRFFLQALVKVLAPIGRVLGYKACWPEQAGAQLHETKSRHADESMTPQ
jgi:quercetin dioxygenase-like cupin family protein